MGAVHFPNEPQLGIELQNLRQIHSRRILDGMPAGKSAPRQLNWYLPRWKESKTPSIKSRNLTEDRGGGEGENQFQTEREGGKPSETLKYREQTEGG